MKMTGRGDENFVIAAHAVRVYELRRWWRGRRHVSEEYFFHPHSDSNGERTEDGRKEGGAENERTQQLFMPRLSSPPRP